MGYHPDDVYVVDKHDVVHVAYVLTQRSGSSSWTLCSKQFLAKPNNYDITHMKVTKRHPTCLACLAVSV